MQICALHVVSANSKQLFSPHTRMSLQLENRWRGNTHHYVRWSDDSRQVIRLYKPRLQQQLVLSPRCGHLKGNGGVKAVTADSNSISFSRLCRSAIDHHRHSINTGQCAISRVVNLGAGVTFARQPHVATGETSLHTPTRVDHAATSASAISQLLNYLIIRFYCIFNGNLNIRTTFACASLRAIGSGNCLSNSRVRFTRFSNVLPSCISQRLR